MDESLNKLYEMMGKINPEFKLKEDSFPTSFDNTNNQETTDNSINTDDLKNGDAKNYNNVIQKSTSINKASNKINTSTEFPEAFKIWFTKLGYNPNNPSVTISKVTSDIRSIMQELGYK